MPSLDLEADPAKKWAARSNGPRSPSLLRKGGATPTLSAEEKASYLSQILGSRVYEVAQQTELQPAKKLSARLGNTVLFKREDMQQPNFSFKLRGAHNAMASLTEKQLRRGVVACSAGNHAQGVAISANKLGTSAIICMPTATPAIKVDAVRALGGNIRLIGANYDEAYAEASRIVAEEGKTLIHPFDDPLVIAGQGTVGMEILTQSCGQALHAVFVCCGGGGLLAGIALYLKQTRPEVLVIGVEAEDAAGMTASVAQHSVHTLDHVGAFADGAAVKTVGANTTRICSALVDAMVTVSADEICAA